jgi:serine/threonine protein kinase
VGERPILRAGAMVDHHRVMRLLGQGGMGEVYLARDTRLGRKVALKLVHARLDGNERARERFLHEARATATFNHPHIVTVYGVGEANDGTPYLALEYVAGETLARRIAAERPSLREAMRIGLAIAEALEEAHRHDILHRDLKPANVLVGSDGRLRVVDFGIAKMPAHASDGASISDDAGTPAYMAPEQWRDKESTPATDVWALGIILHELVYGAHPYESFDSVAAMRLSIASPRAPVPIGPGPSRRAPVELADHPELERLIARCLDKEALARPRAAEVRAALAALVGGVPFRGGSGAGERAESPFRGLLPFTEQHAALFSAVLRARRRDRRLPRAAARRAAPAGGRSVGRGQELVRPRRRGAAAARPDELDGARAAPRRAALLGARGAARRR